MKGYLTYFFEQHKRMTVGYVLMIVIALLFAVCLKSATVPASATMLYIGIFATLAPVPVLNSDREIDELLSLPGGRKKLIKAQYLNSVIAIAASLFAAAVVSLLTYAFTLGKARLPSPVTSCLVFSAVLLIVAVMLPLSMVFGRKGLLIGFGLLMFMVFQFLVRELISSGGAVIYQILKDYAATNKLEGISVVINANIKSPRYFTVTNAVVWLAVSISAFVSSYVIAGLVFSRKSFGSNKL